MSLPPQVREVTDSYLGLLDRAAPGLVDGLYLHGSVALGDFCPGRSDIDFVAVTAERPDATGVETLRGVHEQTVRLHPRPHFDGCYLTRSDLAAAPDETPDVPGCFEGTFGATARTGVGLVTWHELAEYGATVHGPDLRGLTVWTDRPALLDHTRTNLQTYWRGWIDRLERLPTAAPDRVNNPWFVDWCVLGAVRLHALLETNRLHSKGGAGRYALGTFDGRWHPILTEALRIREGSDSRSAYPDPLRRLEETKAFVEFVVEAHA